jgi:molybdate transport system substrate-binding protein
LKKIASFLCGVIFLVSNLHAQTLTVSAASSLTNAFKDIVFEFEKQYPNVKVQLNFAASGSLVQQIIKGAPVDVFASADQETMNKLSDKKIIKSADRYDFASNTLVIIVPQTSKKIPSKLEQLTDSNYQRVAIGLPASVPVGKYTQMVLQKQGLWVAIEAKMIGSQNVRQVLDYVARGEVDAGFVYATDAAMMTHKVKVALSVPTEEKILYPIASITTSSQYPLAQKFVSFVQSEKAREILKRYGFGSVSK